MSQIVTPAGGPVVYPDSDGKPMADNTKQYDWIVTLKENLEALFRDRPDVFVAGNNLIYAKEGNPKVRAAPDVYVAFGRPKGDRGSYQVWEEGGIFPQVVFEVRSPGNRAGGMARKLAFYDRYGAEEYYDYDPDRSRLLVYRRADGEMDEVPVTDQYVSPRLGIRFDLTGPELAIYYPSGERFLTAQETRRLAEQAERAERRATAAAVENERLRGLLRQAGIDPDAPAGG